MCRFIYTILHPNNHQMAQQVFIYTIYTTTVWRGFSVSVPRCIQSSVSVSLKLKSYLLMYAYPHGSI